MEVKWTKVTEQLPEEGKEYLVWTGHEMLVSVAEFYDEDTYKYVPVEHHESLRKSKGYFAEFGSKHYFDDKELQYTELPKPPRE